ncbi:MAG: type 1 glutamine amidotransferase domain-containing protein [Saprospiraceae bacterium]|nr:type 1 glutamine amidotransferase domain-containing protein [Saprospiraceae bacterium]
MNLSEKRIAILATDGFEEDELFSPLNTLKEHGANVDIVSYKSGDIRGWKGNNWSKSITVDKTVDQASESDYHALVIPGGVANPDSLRQDEGSVNFVRSFFKSGKPVASICHGPQVLIEAGVVEGRRMTSYNSIKTDLKNAGAQWVDEPVVVDQGLVTSRHPGDLDAFNDKLIEEVREGIHEEQTA